MLNIIIFGCGIRNRERRIFMLLWWRS